MKGIKPQSKLWTQNYLNPTAASCGVRLLRNLMNNLKFYKNWRKDKRGVSLIITMLVLTALLTISFGVTTLLSQEIKLERGIENSAIAYFAADSGIERTLWDIRKKAPAYNPVAGNKPYVDILLLNGAVYTIEVTQTSPAIKIRSSGIYHDTNRAIEITY